MESRSSCHFRQHRNRPPYIILDSSFIFGRTLHQDKFDPPAFRERCAYLSNARWPGLRLIAPIHHEIQRLAIPFSDHPDTARGLRHLRSIPHYPLTPQTEDRYLFDFFITQMSSINERRMNSSGNNSLSFADITYGAYSLIKTLKSDVIAATHDYELIRTMKRVYEIAHPVLVQRKYPDKSLLVALTIEELENRFDEIKVIREQRRARFELRTSEHNKSFQENEHVMSD